MTTETLDDLRERARQHPPERFPVQHATVQFHLGTLLSQRERYADAEAALVTAARLFRPRLPVELGKTLIALGAVLRAQRRLDEAVGAFEHAGELLDTGDHPLERGAACFNLGLVRSEAVSEDATEPDLRSAVEAFAEAVELLDPERVPRQAAAARRELGGALLRAGDADGAVAHLTEAVALARAGGDQAGLGSAANALGLAELASGRPDRAVESLSTAANAHPRSLRPEAYAMAKANLALAREAAGDPLAARLAARQARDTAECPEPARAQAVAVLDRVGDEPGGLLTVLDAFDADERPAAVRDELARWADLPAPDRHAEGSAWVAGQLDRRGRGTDLAEALLGGVLELPPGPMRATLASLVIATGDLDPDDAERIRTQVGSAMARFHVPQWMRLKHTLNALAEEAGQEPAWR